MPSLSQERGGALLSCLACPGQICPIEQGQLAGMCSQDPASLDQTTQSWLNDVSTAAWALCESTRALHELAQDMMGGLETDPPIFLILP